MESKMIEPTAVCQRMAAPLRAKTIIRTLEREVKCTRYARARLRIPAGTPWSFAMGVEPDVTPTGFR